MVGEVIADRYELEELVGSGGMSSVFRAHDTLLERHVALKLLHDHVAQDFEQVERFRREARSVARLSHPNIVTIIDRGERDGRQYIVFEFVEGENLKQLVERSGPLPVRRALDLALEIARALAFAHREGLVHRDVKPQNVLIPAGGEAKVTDFGIARPVDVEELTQSGDVVGTSHYIAPEQARGQAVDERTDVYSLGAVLYELLTGEVPFTGDNFVTVALRHVREPAPHVRERRPDVSSRLDAAVARALAKDPAERFASMDELAAELERCLAELPPDLEHAPTMVVPAATPPVPVEPVEPVAPQPPRRRRRGLFVPLLLAALLGIAAAAAVALIHFGVPDLGVGGGRRTTTDGGEHALHAVPVTAVATYDPPPGDGREHDDTVPRATDGDPASFWTTEGYRSGLGEKSGVGLVLDTHGKHVSQLTVASDTTGFTAEIKTGGSEGGPFDTVASGQTIAETPATFRLERSARYLLIWITELAHPDVFRAHVNEVSAKG